MEQEELNEIVVNHDKWLHNNNYGEYADLSEENLSEANLTEANLCRADLHEANLCEANLCEADLERTILCRANLKGANLEGTYLVGADLYEANLAGADLCEANLAGADLEKANMCGANLCRTNLEGTILPSGIYQIVGAGSYNRCTTYDTINDQVVCGCWDDGAGNKLNSFARRIKEIYGPNGKEPNLVYYTEYMAAIDFFKAMKKLNKRT